MASVTAVHREIDSGSLGRTLMHEHLATAFPGGEYDTLNPGADRRDMVAKCVDRIEELKDGGFSTLVDPCPIDMGRDVGLMAEVAARTGFNIICATGLYNESHGASSYWRIKFAMNPRAMDELVDLMVRELTEGIGGTDIKAGVIKLATGHGAITDYERNLFTAAARASLATGAPITTHTDGVLGVEQVELLTGLGVDPCRIIVGHSCANPDHLYHMAIAKCGAYVGFDRFGLESIAPDEQRIESLVRFIEAGALKQAIVSHDAVWCLGGAVISPDEWARHLEETGGAMRFSRVIAPRLKELGVDDDAIDELLIGNPRRYFAGAECHKRQTGAN